MDEAPLRWTGERYVPWVDLGSPEIHYEHLHRYLFASHLARGRTVLDVGCGEGYGAFLVAQRADHVVGIDIDSEAIRHATTKYIKRNLSFEVGTLEKFVPESNKRFDLITCFEVIEHIDREKHGNLLKLMADTLTPTGILIVSTPNKLSYSDARKFNNPFHVSEMYFGEFRDKLQEVLPNSRFLGQRVFAGSTMWSLGDVNGEFVDLAINKGTEGTYWEVDAAHKHPMYFIGVASRSSLSVVPEFSNLSDLADELVQRPLRELGEVQQMLEKCTTEVERARSEIAATLAREREHVAQAEKLVALAEVDAKEARELATQGEEEVLAARAEAARALQAATDAERIMGEAEQLCLEAEAKAEGLEGKLAGLQGAVEKSQAQRYAKAMDAVEELQPLVDAFEHSLTWRLAKRLQRLKRHHQFDSLAELADTLTELRDGLRGLREQGDFTILAALAAERAHELLESRSVRVSRTLVWVSSLLRGRLPGPGALESIARLTSELRVLTLDPIPEGNRPQHHLNTLAPSDDRYRRQYMDALKRTQRLEEQEAFVPMTTVLPLDPEVKIVAFYLPQFYSIRENDQNWEIGFTEWTNVTRAVPQFVSHQQPHLPIDVGFYDLRVVETIKKQAEIAKKYGVHAFCIHHYWFHGTKVLRRPIDEILAHPEIDIKFCLNWANENWTRAWDGLDNEVLLEQHYSPEDDLAFIADAEKYLRDPRYLRVSGRPVLVVYRASLLPDPAATAKRWKEYCRAAGIGDLYLVSTHAFDFLDPRSLGFDATIEYAPNNFPLSDVSSTVEMLNPEFQGRILSYDSALLLAQRYQEPPYTKFRGVCPSWDNEPRRPGKGTVLYGSTPEKYESWLDEVVGHTMRHRIGDERMVFVNAWNEWAEGAHLEPDRTFGYGYLQKTHDVLLSNMEIDSGVHIDQVKSVAVVLHLYYTDLWPKLADVLDGIPVPFDLYVTVPTGCQKPGQTVRDVRTRFPGARIYRTANRGRDVLPFLQVLRDIVDAGYECALKVHSKKSLHRADGNLLREQLLGGLVGSGEVAGAIIERFRKERDLGIVAPRKFVVPIRDHLGSNLENINRLAKRLGLVRPVGGEFVMGTMFWFRPEALRPLVEIGIGEKDFPPELGQLDGEVQHALERIILQVSQSCGFRTSFSEASSGRSGLRA